MNQKIANNILPKLFGSSQIFVTSDPESVLKNGKGDNHKGIIILYQEEADPELIEFLNKILQAAKLNIEKDIWVKGITANEQISWSNLKSEIKVQYLLSFGLHAKQIGLVTPFQEFHPTLAFDTTFLFAPRLSQLHNDKPAKAQLWKALQEMFL